MDANLPDIIKDRKMLPEVIKKEIISSIFFNCILFIIMLIITLIINVSFNELDVKEFDSYIDIIQIFGAIISVVVLETAYRKDSLRIWIYGLELLVFSISTLFVPYMYIFKGNIEFLKNVMFGFSVYYIIKSIVTFLHTRNKYLRENMSDIKDLVKEEKNSYINEESTKTLKKQKIEAENRKKLKEEKLKKNKAVQEKQNKLNIENKNIKKANKPIEKENSEKKSTKRKIGGIKHD